MSERELWDDAIRAAEDAGMGEMAVIMLRMGADGHRNRRHIVQHWLHEVTGCSCGADEPCAPDVHTPERNRLREALQRLSNAIGVPEKVARGNSPP